jgi:uncharacterized damage-inducible protein DinB
MTTSAEVAAIQRDDGTAIADLISIYERGVGELNAAVAGITGAQARARPIPGKWSTLEVLCHLADCEQFYADRLKRTLAMERPLLLGADGSRYPDPLCYQQRDLAEELELVRITRANMARILHLLPEAAWQRTAVHSETGLVTLRQLVFHAIRHIQHHLPFIAEKRAALS